MKNIEKLKYCFSQVLGIDLTLVVDSLAYNSIGEWDSVAHMRLVADIESQFGIMLDTDQIIDLSSFGKAQEIIKSAGVNLDE